MILLDFQQSEWSAHLTESQVFKYVRPIGPFSGKNEQAHTVDDPCGHLPPLNKQNQSYYHSLDGSMPPTPSLSPTIQDLYHSLGKESLVDKVYCLSVLPHAWSAHHVSPTFYLGSPSERSGFMYIFNWSEQEHLGFHWCKFREMALSLCFFFCSMEIFLLYLPPGLLEPNQSTQRLGVLSKYFLSLSNPKCLLGN